MLFLSVVILLVLLIPLTAIVLDSDVGRALARRLGSETSDSSDEMRIQQLEQEVRYLSETVNSLQEETVFIRKLLEKPESQPSGDD